ncbi:MAG: FAD-dependent oxidoreductase, partial [Planctomycetota bacterium]
MYDYDVIVIGAGSAGLVACKVASGLGKKTALVEKNKIGGDCTWFGCIPSKTLIKAANIAHDISRLNEFGIKSDSEISLDYTNVMTHVRAVVEADGAAHPVDSYEKEGINVLFGTAKFINEHQIEINGKKKSAKKFIICSGSRPTVPSIEGLDQVSYLTNETIFDLEKLPKSMITLGAGPIGIELSAALNRLGVDVTVLLRSGQILKKDDKELVDRLFQILQDEGLKILTETKTKSFTTQDGNVIAHIEDKDGDHRLEAESLLIAIGRTPNVDSLALENAGVEFDKKGIKVDKHLRTTAKNIYAAGDVVPPYLFTHMAEYEAVIAATNACPPLPIRKTNYENALWCTYTDPELAHAGLTEEQARQKYGDNIRIYRWEHRDVDRAKTDMAKKGISKFICNKKGKLLGIHILGHGAGELMHEAQLAKSLGLPFSKIASVIHAYPSYSDAVRQPAKRCYIDMLQDNFFIKIIKSLNARKNRKRLMLVVIVLALLIGLRLSGVGDKFTLENLQSNAARLKEFSNGHYLISVLAYILIYIAVTAFSLPGATILTLAGGFLYTFFIGALYVNIAATSGATLAFLFSRYIAGQSIQNRYGDKLARFNDELNRNGARYLLTLRFIPIFPFFLINVFAGLTNIPLKTFVWTTSVGIFPGSLVYAYAGQQLGTIESVGDIFTGKVLAAFLLLAAFAFVPAIYNKIKAHKLEKRKASVAPLVAA